MWAWISGPVGGVSGGEEDEDEAEEEPLKGIGERRSESAFSFATRASESGSSEGERLHPGQPHLNPKNKNGRMSDSVWTTRPRSTNLKLGAFPLDVLPWF